MARDQLTDAEQRVVELVAHGHTNVAIAAALFISPNTVGSHLQRISDKVGTRNRAGIVGEAYRRGWLTVEGGVMVLPASTGTVVPRARRAPRESGGAPVGGPDGRLAAEVTQLRLTLEMARRRLGMGLLGQVIGRDTAAAGVEEAREIIDRAIGAYQELAAHVAT